MDAFFIGLSSFLRDLSYGEPTPFVPFYFSTNRIDANKNFYPRLPWRLPARSRFGEGRGEGGGEGETNHVHPYLNPPPSRGRIIVSSFS